MTWSLHTCGVLELFGDRCVLRIADLTARRRAAGRPVQAFDALIAVTALRHGLAVVTRNVADFEVGGLRVVDPSS